MQPEPLTDEALDGIIRDGLAQVALMDQMEAALLANDVLKLIDVAREMVRLDHAHEVCGMPQEVKQ